MVFFLLVLLTGGCSFSPPQVLIDSFEGVLNSETVDFGAGNGAVLKISADKELKMCGQQSIKLDYYLKPSSYMWAARGYGLDVKGAALWDVNPRDIDWNKYNAVSVAMFGRNSGAVFAFDIKDNGGELWRFLLNDDFQGWKEIRCPFSEFFDRRDWQPETAQRNAVLDFPIMSFQMEPRMPGKGICNFDCVKLVKVK